MAYRGAIAGLGVIAGLTLLNPSQLESASGQISAYMDVGSRPWALSRASLVNGSIDFFYEANALSVAVLHSFYSLERYRKAGGGAGAVNFASLDISGRLSNIASLDHHVSTDDRAVVVFTSRTDAPLGFLASTINDGNGRVIAGIYDGSSILAPDGSTISVPTGVIFTSGQLVVTTNF